MEKIGPTQFEAELAKLRAEGKMPSLDDVLSAVGEARKKYRSQILDARKGESDASNGE